MTAPRIIDISPHQQAPGQPDPDWAAIRASGVVGVYLRGFEGKDLDEVPGGYSLERHRRAALDAGLLVGAYQYLRARHRGAWQAEQLLVALGDLGPGELPPAVDVEELDGRTVVETQACLLDWVTFAERCLGVPPVVYTGWHFWTQVLHGAVLSELARCPLWLAAYTRDLPPCPKPWGKVALWQHTDKAQVPGLRGGIDLSEWQGDEASLRAWAERRC